jgi:hypothetical protein
MKLGTSTVVRLAFAFNLAWGLDDDRPSAQRRTCDCLQVCDTASMT